MLDNKPNLWYNKYIKRKENLTNQNGIDTMANKKMTKKDYFNALLAMPEVQANTEMVEFLEHEIDLLTRKNSGERKPTATQKANEVIKAAIFEGMEDNRCYSITEMIKEIPECNELSNQKVAVLVRQLMDDGKVEKIVEKRRSLFRKVM